MRHTLGERMSVHPLCRGREDRLRKLRCVGDGATPRDVME